MKNLRSNFCKGLALAAFTAWAGFAVAEDNPSRNELRAAERQHSITVTGSGEVSMIPDEAVVRLGMTALNSRASVAQAKVNEIIQKTVNAIEKIGVKRQSIHTAGISLTPNFSEKFLSSGGSKISGFRADNVVEVTVDDLKLVGDVIDAAVGAGANEVQGVSFRVKDDVAQRSSVLALAAQQAKSKAETIAKALGGSLGNVIEVIETGGGVPFKIEAAEAMTSFMTPASQAPTRIEPGQIRIMASVVARYEILREPARR